MVFCVQLVREQNYILQVSYTTRNSKGPEDSPNNT